MSILSHLRSIGDRTYKVNQKLIDGVFQDETIQTTIAEDEIADFKEDWEENWHPSTYRSNEHHELILPMLFCLQFYSS